MDANSGSRKAVLLVFAVFVLGIALGGVSIYTVTARVQAARAQTTAHSPANTMAMFTRDLNLTSEQQTQIQSILGDTRARYGVLHDKFDPEYERVRQEGRERIRQTLTTEQRPKFEDLLQRIDEDRRKRQAEQGH